MRNKYKKQNNTFIRDIQSDKKDRIEVEIGDSKQDKFIPQFKTKHWDNETNFSMRYVDDLSGTVRQVGNKIEYIKPKEEVHFYEKPTIGEKGGYETVISLDFFNMKQIDRNTNRINDNEKSIIQTREQLKYVIEVIDNIIDKNAPFFGCAF